MTSPGSSYFIAIVVCFAAPFSALAQKDGPAVNPAEILRSLKTMREQQSQQIKLTRQKALQQAQAAASDSGRALEMWEDAVRATQFDGVSREAAQYRDWKEKEGEALKESQGALHLYFSWLSLSLQRASGSTVKQMLPAVVNYTKEATADAESLQTAEEMVKHEKEIDPGKKRPVQTRRANEDQVRQMHDKILKQALNGSVVVQWLRVAELLPEAGKKGDSNGRGWELAPGNIDGIFQSIVLPELRSERDPRVLEYWDMKLKQEADAATRSKLSFEVDKFNQLRKPQILWSRAQDEMLIGQRNRAEAEMFSLIKTYPSHPDAANWMNALEQALLPPASPTAATPTQPAPEPRHSEAANVSVPPPLPVSAPLAAPEPPPADAPIVLPPALPSAPAVSEAPSN